MRIASFILLLLVAFLNFYRFQLPIESDISLFDLYGSLAWATMFVHAMFFKTYREGYAVLSFLLLTSLQWAWKEYNGINIEMKSDWVLAAIFFVFSIFVYIFTPIIQKKIKHIIEWNSSTMKPKKK